MRNNREKEILNHINKRYNSLKEIKSLLKHYNENKDLYEEYRFLFPEIVEGKIIDKYIPTVEEYISLENTLISSSKLKEINREKYNITDIAETEEIDQDNNIYINKYKFQKIKNEKFSISETREQLKLLKKIFTGGDNAFICFRNRKTGDFYSYNINSVLNEQKLYRILNSSKLKSKKDLMFSLNLFTNMKRLATENIFTLNCFAIDVDYKEVKKFSGKSPKEIINILERTEFEKNIPTPNIVEYSNNIRLIYCLDKAYSTKAVNSLVTKICRKIGDRLVDYNGKGQPLSTYARVVNSINSKNNKTVKVVYMDVEKYKIKELQESVLPPLTEWNPEYKVKSKRRVIHFDKNFKAQANFKKNNEARIWDFFRIQEYFDFEPELRRFLCFQVRNHAILAGYANEEAEALLKKFNNRFKYPLRWNVIESDTRNVERKQYLYKSVTILTYLDIDTDLEILLELKGIVSPTEQARRNNEHNKCKQKARYRNNEGLTKTQIKRRDQFIQIARMELEGMSQRAIAERLGYKDNSVINRKINKVYEKINYLEIFEEVKKGLYEDLIERA